MPATEDHNAQNSRCSQAPPVRRTVNPRDQPQHQAQCRKRPEAAGQGDSPSELAVAATRMTWTINQLARLFYPTADTASSRRFQMPDWPALHQELKRPHMSPSNCCGRNTPSSTRTAATATPSSANATGVGARQQKRSMRQFHKAGEKCFVDYAGATVPIINADTGEIREAQIFVAALGCLQLHLRRSHLDPVAAGLARQPRTHAGLLWRLHRPDRA